jgi:hypothetical protein
LRDGLGRFGGGASSEPRRVYRVGRGVGSAGSGSAVIRPPALGPCLKGRLLDRGAGGEASSYTVGSSSSSRILIFGFRPRFDFFFGGLPLGFGF